MRRYFLVMDFECLHPGVWQSVGIVLFQQQGRHFVLIDQFQTACARPPSPRTRQFWTQHPVAYAVNRAQGLHKSAAIEEVQICQFITRIKQQYPSFFLVSDAPEHDVALMNTILTTHGYDTMSHRSDTVYFQTLCTWSMKRVLDLLGLDVVVEDRLRLESPVLVPHTPLYDCYRLFNVYVCLMHTIAHRTKKTGVLQYKK
jgi:hypothetical protein